MDRPLRIAQVVTGRMDVVAVREAYRVGRGTYPT